VWLTLFAFFSMSLYARQIGCRVDKVKAEAGLYHKTASLAAKKVEHLRAVLTLPLAFPQIRKGASKQGWNEKYGWTFHAFFSFSCNLFCEVELIK
jgi:hypothetical protein